MAWKSKYFWWSAVAVFAWFFATDWLIHGKILSDMYAETASVWRPGMDMNNYFVWMVLGQFAIAFWMCWIFPYGYKNEGSWEGVRFGMWIGFLSCGHYFIQYATLPIPMKLLWAWCALAMVQSMAAGWLLWKVWAFNPKALRALSRQTA